MTLRLILLALLLPALANAGQGMGPGPGFKTYGGSTCSTQSLLLNQTGTLSAAAGDVYGTSVQAYKITGNGKKLYSVKFKTSTTPQGSASTYTVYVNSALNFSGTNTDSFNISTPGTTSTEFTGLSVAQPTLANGTDYYIGISDQDGTWGARINLTLIDGPGTTPVNNFWSATTLGGTYTQSSNYAMWAEVRVCD